MVEKVTDRIAILGAGMAGFGAAYRFGEEGLRPPMYERGERHGGHTVSYVHDSGFIFDDGPHVSFTKDERMKELFAGFVGGKYELVESRVNNYWHGQWVKHPAICNLHGLPDDLVASCIEDFVAAHRREPTEIRNYEEWLLATYGRAFYDNFPKDYTVRYHTAPAKQMDIDWLGPRLYRPELREVLLGALSAQTADVHYVENFRYPTHGGFQPYIDPLPEVTDLRLRHEVVGIDPGEGILCFADGSSAEFEHLVSSLPLPELIRVLPDVPDEVSEAASLLAASTCVVVNVGVDRADLSEAQWTYFYDRDIFFTRLSYPHMLSPNMAPEGAGSFQAECYYSDKYRPLERTPESCIEPVVRDLRRCGLIRVDDTILHTNATVTRYANVIFDLDRAPSLKIVNGYLDELSIARCGRYAEWLFHWTDESFRSGEAAAQLILDRL